VAAAAGFTAAAVVTPKRGEKLSEKLSHVASKLTPDASAAAPESASAASGAAKPMFAATLLSSLFDLARTAIEKSIEASSTAMNHQQAAPPQPPGDEAPSP
jgi:hypothetical protein